MKKKIAIISGIVLIAVLAIGVVPVAASEIAANTTPSSMQQISKGQLLCRLLLIQDEAKTDALLAQGVASGRITADQSAKIKDFWIANHGKVAKEIALRRIIRVKDGAKLDAFLAKAVDNGKISADQAAKIKAVWTDIHSK
jgi:hypothetical protein